MGGKASKEGKTSQTTSEGKTETVELQQESQMSKEGPEPDKEQDQAKLTGTTSETQSALDSGQEGQTVNTSSDIDEGGGVIIAQIPHNTADTKQATTSTEQDGQIKSTESEDEEQPHEEKNEAEEETPTEMTGKDSPSKDRHTDEESREEEISEDEINAEAPLQKTPDQADAACQNTQTLNDHLSDDKQDEGNIVSRRESEDDSKDFKEQEKISQDGSNVEDTLHTETPDQADATCQNTQTLHDHQPDDKQVEGNIVSRRTPEDTDSKDLEEQEKISQDGSNVEDRLQNQADATCQNSQTLHDHQPDDKQAEGNTVSRRESEDDSKDFEEQEKGNIVSRRTSEDTDSKDLDEQEKISQDGSNEAETPDQADDTCQNTQTLNDHQPDDKQDEGNIVSRRKSEDDSKDSEEQEKISEDEINAKVPLQKAPEQADGTGGNSETLHDHQSDEKQDEGNVMSRMGVENTDSEDVEQEKISEDEMNAAVTQQKTSDEDYRTGQHTQTLNDQQRDDNKEGSVMSGNETKTVDSNDVKEQEKAITAGPTEITPRQIPPQPSKRMPRLVATHAIPGMMRPIKFYTHMPPKEEDVCKALLTRLEARKLKRERAPCDIILAFCPAGTDVEAALKEIPVTKSCILVMIHFTLDPEYEVPDSRIFVEGRDTITVDCLFHEDTGLLQSSRNDAAVDKIIKYLGGGMHGEEKGPKSVTVPEPGREPVPQPDPEPDLEPDSKPVPQPKPEPDLEPGPEPVPQPDPEPDLEPDPEPVSQPDPEPDLEPDLQPKPMVVLGEKYEMKHAEGEGFSQDESLKTEDITPKVEVEKRDTVAEIPGATFLIQTGTKTVRLYTVIPEVVKVHCESLTRMLYDKKLINKTEQSSVEDCDVILAFCPVVSRLGTDVEAALKNIPDTKHCILVVMHFTLDPCYVVPESSRFVNKEDVVVVDCLFNEDEGLIGCERNHTALDTIRKNLEEYAKGRVPEPHSSNSRAGKTTEQPTEEIERGEVLPTQTHQGGEGQDEYDSASRQGDKVPLTAKRKRRCCCWWM